ncbi:MAG: periplasmic heavy metal sensor [Candidatus Margulisbacteria bacterium]|jgi:Spy/CpxP family protein refolding chaperone|nr:periplasmic heavy metal sensor [Candidatus Margulisiibacteriota bacterium]
MSKTVKVLALLMIVWLIGSSAYAAPWWGGRERQKDPGKQLARRLKLTPAQQEQFKSAREKLEKENKPLFDKIKERSEKLRTEMGKDQPDQRAIEQSIKEINGWRTEIELKRVNSLLALKASLTPEQRQEYLKMMQPKRFGRGSRK